MYSGRPKNDAFHTFQNFEKFYKNASLFGRLHFDRPVYISWCAYNIGTIYLMLFPSRIFYFMKLPRGHTSEMCFVHFKIFIWKIHQLVNFWLKIFVTHIHGQNWRSLKVGVPFNILLKGTSTLDLSGVFWKSFLWKNRSKIHLNCEDKALSYSLEEYL